MPPIAPDRITIYVQGLRKEILYRTGITTEIEDYRIVNPEGVDGHIAADITCDVHVTKNLTHRVRIRGFNVSTRGGMGIENPDVYAPIVRDFLTEIHAAIHQHGQQQERARVRHTLGLD